jgi:hypothetical protein
MHNVTHIQHPSLYAEDPSGDALSRIDVGLVSLAVELPLPGLIVGGV